eukprot:Sspe_Gene.2963::Locus_986_Transcript_1_1_Confidence_1.000_Length_1515::g.2963::m.2963
MLGLSVRRWAVGASRAARARNFGTLPEWVSVMRGMQQEDAGKAVSYDIRVFDELFMKEERFETENHIGVDTTTFNKLTMGEPYKKYVCVGEAFAFPDHLDSPVVNDPSHPLKLWWDPSSPTEKVLVQLAKHFPPILWLPIKPAGLKRLLADFTTIDAIIMERYLPIYERIQQQIEKERGELDLHMGSDRFMDELRFLRAPLYRDFAETTTLYLGCVEHPTQLERNFAKGGNRYVFSWPIRKVENTEQEGESERPVTSAFRTIYSKSLVALHFRQDLAFDGDIPVFAVVNYPNMPRLAGGAASRFNSAFKTSFPESIPVDVVGALSDFPARGLDYLAPRVWDLVAALPTTELGRTREDHQLQGQIARDFIATAVVSRSETEFREAAGPSLDALRSRPERQLRVAAAVGCFEAGLMDEYNTILLAEENKEVAERIKHHCEMSEKLILAEHTAESASKITMPDAAAV